MDADFKSIGGINVEPGALIAKRFEICDRLGAGGVGMVFRAIDHELDGEVVALKLLHPHLAQDENVFRRFRNEVLVARSLSHPNIVRTHDMGRAEAGFSYISMEYVDGQSLKDKLTSGDKPRGLPFKDAVSVLYQIISGVAYAHGKGVIHRDLKPANVMISSKGEVKLADFGTARIVGGDTSLTQTGQVIGTPDYMSPEQIRGEQLDHGCDIYSLGIVAYELVVGARPFVADSAVAVAFKHLNDPIPEFANAQTGVPLWYDRVVRKATAKKKEDRFATAMEFAAALLESVPELSMQSTFFGMERPLVRAPASVELPTNGKLQNGASLDSHETMITPTAVSRPPVNEAVNEKAFEIGKRTPDRDAQDWKLGSIGAESFPSSPREQPTASQEGKGIGAGTAAILIIGSLLVALAVIPRVSAGASASLSHVVAGLGGNESLPGFLLASLTGAEAPNAIELPQPTKSRPTGAPVPTVGALASASLAPHPSPTAQVAALPPVPTVPTATVSTATVSTATGPTATGTTATGSATAGTVSTASHPTATLVMEAKQPETAVPAATPSLVVATNDVPPEVAPTVAPVPPREVLVSVELRQAGKTGPADTISVDQLASVRWIADAQGLSAREMGVTAERVKGEFAANVVDPKEARVLAKLKPEGVDLSKAEGSPTHISGSLAGLRGSSPRAGQYRLDVLRNGEIVASTDFSLYRASIQPTTTETVTNSGGGVITIVTEGRTGDQGRTSSATPSPAEPMQPPIDSTSIVSPPTTTRSGLPRAKGHNEDEPSPVVPPDASQPTVSTIAPQLPAEPAPSVASTETYSGVLMLPLKSGGDERHAVTLNLIFTDGTISGNATVDGFGQFAVSGSVLPRGLAISLANVGYNFGLSSGPKKQNLGGTVQSAILRQNGTWQVSRTR